jgi:hypothetical protein
MKDPSASWDLSDLPIEDPLLELAGALHIIDRDVEPLHHVHLLSLETWIELFYL